MTLVVDASVAVRWLFPVARDGQADDLARVETPLIAPDLVLAEIANAAWKFVTFDGLSPQAATTIVLAADKAFDELVPSAGLKNRALQIAIELRHPVYDCFYLALAEQRDCQLVTADERLLRACGRTEFAKRIRRLGSPRRRR
jgi:predicted nucleic acid-binding protein